MKKNSEIPLNFECNLSVLSTVVASQDGDVKRVHSMLLFKKHFLQIIFTAEILPHVFEPESDSEYEHGERDEPHLCSALRTFSAVV